MIERFRGDEGFQRLVETLRRQKLVRDDEGLASVIARSCTLHEYLPGSTLIAQNDSDNDISLILVGRVSIQIHGREVAQRVPGDCVGEMALIDPSARRTADVVAIQEVVVAKLSEPIFSDLADQYPRLWRILALELGDRLRQRSDHVAVRNETPRLFIGSSTESLKIANKLRQGFDHDPIATTVWTDGVFGPSRFPIEDLENQAKQSDFAALVLGADDRVVSREVEFTAPRDNVVFELGLFMGALSHRRVFLVYPRGMDLKIPTDLLGLTPARYLEGTPDTLLSRLEPVCKAIRNAIIELGPK